MLLYVELRVEGTVVLGEFVRDICMRLPKRTSDFLLRELERVSVKRMRFHFPRNSVTRRS